MTFSRRTIREFLAPSAPPTGTDTNLPAGGAMAEPGAAGTTRPEASSAVASPSQRRSQEAPVAQPEERDDAARAAQAAQAAPAEPAAPDGLAVSPAPAEQPPTQTARRDGDGIASAIAMDGASRRFGDFTAVESLTLNVPAGTILGVIGPSGSGKTTTIRMLTGAIKPTRGTVRVLGDDPAHFRRQTRERIGYMPQSFVLYPELTTAQNVGFVGALFGMLWLRRRRRVREVLQLVGLWEVRGRPASKLSGGMQRRLELACALVHEPTVLFLDEPTAGIDPILRQEVWTELRRLRDAGRTIVVTTQYVGEAEYCDYVALIAEGRLIGLAEPEDLRRDALGGEVLEIETREPIEGDVFRNVTGVRAVRQRTPHDLFVIVDDAGTASPALVEAAAQAGVDIISSREYRPPMDEVFTELVTRDRREREAADGAGGGDANAKAEERS